MTQSTGDKYHFSTTTGKVEACNAYKRTCKFQIQGQPHFATEAEADAYGKKIEREKAEKQSNILKIMLNGSKQDKLSAKEEIWEYRYPQGVDTAKVYWDGKFLGTFPPQFNKTFWDYYYKNIDTNDLTFVPVKERWAVYGNGGETLLKEATSLQAAKIAFKKFVAEDKTGDTGSGYEHQYFDDKQNRWTSHLPIDGPVWREHN